jgi:amino acid transporter
MLAAELVVLAIFIVIGIVAVAQGKGRGFSWEPIFNSGTFSWSLIFGAASIAVLSFLGFDGISTLAEENRDSARQIGRAMIFGLLIAGVLFIVQTWVAALFVADPAGLIANGDAAGTAFYDAAEVAGGHWLNVLTAVSTAIAWGFANSLVAQAATSRLLFAMARDRQLPSFLSRVNARHRVPANATILVAILSLGIGIWMSRRETGITDLVTLVNFGAMIAFMVLHVSVVSHFTIRGRSKDLWKHLIAPVIGFLVLGAVVYNQNVLAQKVGGIWLAVGLVVMIVLILTGRGLTLSGLTSDAPPSPSDKVDA